MTFIIDKYINQYRFTPYDDTDNNYKRYVIQGTKEYIEKTLQDGGYITWLNRFKKMCMYGACVTNARVSLENSIYYIEK